MNDNLSPMWHQPHENGHENGASDLNDDFSSFLNFNDISLGLTSPFDNDGSNGGVGEPLAMDTDFCLDGDNARSASADGNGMPPVTQAELMDMQFHDLQKSMEQAQMMNHQHHQHGMHQDMIPPTPSSMEMHAGLPQATLHNIHPQMMMDRFSMYREEPMIFTPLVSPAVTPLETEYTRHIPDFVMPGAFSPLTSPALNAHQHRTHMPNPHMSHNPPAQMQPIEESAESPVIGKKGSNNNGRRKSVTSRNPARVVRESPSMKPQRKRPPPPLTPKLATTLAQQAQQTYPGTPRSATRKGSLTPASLQNTPMQMPHSRDGSSNESVSPEPLPEVLMAPPPRRNTCPENPTVTVTQNGFNAPVTPASLMRLPKTSVRSDDTPPISMDTSEYLNRDVEVTEASRASMMTTTSDSQNTDEMPTPTMNPPSSRTPSLTPSLRPSTAGSVRTSRHTSPLEPQHAGIGKKETARGGRKRGSVSSSPALQPKISPHIKPLLPQGMSPDASALLLASKSNYQNIVEGNHNHLGLQYPEHLSTNLTSKRTSHKIAEQGRRNRINNALAEMASLLPPPATANGEGGGKEQTSKASTVELAIDYIRALKKELEETKGRLKAAEERLESCIDRKIEGEKCAQKEDMEGVEKSSPSGGEEEPDVAAPA